MSGREARRLLGVTAGIVALVLVGCSGESGKQLKKTAEVVFTLQTGTMTALKETENSGPFRDYDVPPDEMIDLVTAVLKTKVVAVFPEPRFGRVIAKERIGTGE